MWFFQINSNQFESNTNGRITCRDASPWCKILCLSLSYAEQKSCQLIPEFVLRKYTVSQTQEHIPTLRLAYTRSGNMVSSVNSICWIQHHTPYQHKYAVQLRAGFNDKSCAILQRRPAVNYDMHVGFRVVEGQMCRIEESVSWIPNSLMSPLSCSLFKRLYPLCAEILLATIDLCRIQLQHCYCDTQKYEVMWKRDATAKRPCQDPSRICAHLRIIYR